MLFYKQTLITGRVNPIFKVVIQNAQGQLETLETTAEHPFWIKDFGWLKASLLQSGMKLLDRHNQELTILSQALIPNKLETVYNIEIESFHTYHVGKLGTWVHNADCSIVSRAILEKRYGPLLDRFFGSNGEVYWIDPLTNKEVQINAFIDVNGKKMVMDSYTGELVDPKKIIVQVDHILPQVAFKEITGFDDLPKNLQEELMNDPENLQPMNRKANQSKGRRVEMDEKGWEKWTNKTVDLGYRAYLHMKQTKMQKKVLDTLAEYKSLHK